MPGFSMPWGHKYAQELMSPFRNKVLKGAKQTSSRQISRYTDTYVSSDKSYEGKCEIRRQKDWTWEHIWECCCRMAEKIKNEDTIVEKTSKKTDEWAKWLSEGKKNS